jgi:hypothetical protein
VDGRLRERYLGGRLGDIAEWDTQFCQGGLPSLGERRPQKLPRLPKCAFSFENQLFSEPINHHLAPH